MEKLKQAYVILINSIVVVFCLAVIFLIGSCYFSGDSKEERLAKEQQQKAIQNAACVAVQNAKSIAKDVNISSYLESMLILSKAGGNRIDVNGWYAVESADGYDIYFEVKENGDLNTFHWTLKRNGLLEGLDKITREIAPDQTINPFGIFVF